MTDLIKVFLLKEETFLEETIVDEVMVLDTGEGKREVILTKRGVDGALISLNELTDTTFPGGPDTRSISTD